MDNTKLYSILDLIIAGMLENKVSRLKYANQAQTLLDELKQREELDNMLASFVDEE